MVIVVGCLLALTVIVQYVLYRNYIHFFMDCLDVLMDKTQDIALSLKALGTKVGSIHDDMENFHLIKEQLSLLQIQQSKLQDMILAKEESPVTKIKKDRVKKEKL